MHLLPRYCVYPAECWVKGSCIAATLLACDQAAKFVSQADMLGARVFIARFILQNLNLRWLNIITCPTWQDAELNDPCALENTGCNHVV